MHDRFDEETMILNDHLEAEALHEVISFRFAYFGPPTEGLLEKVNDKTWSRAFKACSEMADQLLEVRPERRFEMWEAGIGPEAQDVILGLTKSDPAARLTIDQVLAHPWWQEDHDGRKKTVDE